MRKIFILFTIIIFILFLTFLDGCKLSTTDITSTVFTQNVENRMEIDEFVDFTWDNQTNGDLTFVRKVSDRYYLLHSEDYLYIYDTLEGFIDTLLFEDTYYLHYNYIVESNGFYRYVFSYKDEVYVLSEDGYYNFVLEEDFVVSKVEIIDSNNFALEITEKSYDLSGMYEYAYGDFRSTLVYNFTANFIITDSRHILYDNIFFTQSLDFSSVYIYQYIDTEFNLIESLSGQYITGHEIANSNSFLIYTHDFDLNENPTAHLFNILQDGTATYVSELLLDALLVYNQYVVYGKYSLNLEFYSVYHLDGTLLGNIPISKDYSINVIDNTYYYLVYSDRLVIYEYDGTEVYSIEGSYSTCCDIITKNENGIYIFKNYYDRYIWNYDEMIKYDTLLEFEDGIQYFLTSDESSFALYSYQDGQVTGLDFSETIESFINANIDFIDRMLIHYSSNEFIFYVIDDIYERVQVFYFYNDDLVLTGTSVGPFPTGLPIIIDSEGNYLFIDW